MVPFAGYEMPLQYPGGIKHEHLHTRSHAGLFDVSHMGQIRITGESADKALERLVTGDVQALAEYRQLYTLLTNDRGGILDDLMVTRLPDGLRLVVNAARKAHDLDRLQRQFGGDCRVEMLADRALLALQGPEAAMVMEEFDPDIARLDFMRGGVFKLDGAPCLISRSGYTGEDGFEISVASERAEDLAGRLLRHSAVEPVGLGARDSLRLEAGLCLYGHDLDETTTPVEAGLTWTIAGKYRRGEATARFPGADIILQQLRTGPERKRVGLKPGGRIPVREGAKLLDRDGEPAGVVTSGGFGPSVEGPVAMGYVISRDADTGTLLKTEIRNRLHDVTVARLPFIHTRYHKT